MSKTRDFFAASFASIARSFRRSSEVLTRKQRAALMKAAWPGAERLEDRRMLSLSWTWTPTFLPVPNSDGINVSLLMPNGGIMAHGYSSGVSANWYELFPDSHGNYALGGWAVLPSMDVARKFFTSDVLQDDDVFLMGGEYSGPAGAQNFTASAEMYNPSAPASSAWTELPPDPKGSFGDDPSEVLPNGNILCGDIGDNGTEIFDPANDTWTAGPSKVYADQSDEEGWVKLPNGNILNYDIYASINQNRFIAEEYNPTKNQWFDVSPPASAGIPILSTASEGYELGGQVLTPGGLVVFPGADGSVVFYNVNTSTWSVAAPIPESLVEGDAPSAVLPDGNVLMAVSPQGVPGNVFPAITYIYEFNPTTQAYTNVTPSSGLNLFQNSYNFTFLDLPNGQVMVTDTQGHADLFEDNGSPQASWAPHIYSIASNANGTFTLTGTQLTGLDEGSNYGDDWEMFTNYPIIRLTDQRTGAVYYGTSSNWSSVDVGTGTTPETVDFTLSTVLGSDPATVQVVTNGIASNTVGPIQIIYVDQNAHGNNSGGSWPNAFTQLTSALSIAGANALIEVAEGDYSPGNSFGSTFQLIDNVTLQGGYATGGNSGPGVFQTTLDGEYTNEHVVDGSGTNSTAVLNGFTITGATESGLSNDDGSPTIIGCTFTGNDGDEGGAVYDYESSSYFDGCTFSDNTATFGGGVFDFNSTPDFEGCLFGTGNVATYGGGLYEQGGIATISSCTFEGNQADFGAGMYELDSSPYITDSSFRQNQAEDDNQGQGAGAWIDGGTATLIGCDFLSNTADNGGGIYESDGQASLSYCIFQGNTAAVGGGMYNTDSATPNLLECTFLLNHGNQTGGGMYSNDSADVLATACTFDDNTGSYGAGVEDDSNASVSYVSSLFAANSASISGGGAGGLGGTGTFVNCTFTENTADGGGAVGGSSGSWVLENCILWGDSATSVGAEIYQVAGDAFNVTYSDVSGGFSGTGNMNANPQFYGDGNYELEPSSPCINVGNNGAIQSADSIAGVTSDLAGAPRIANGIVDLGAYEAQLIYVDASATGTGDGSSWNNAFTSLLSAIGDAQIIEAQANLVAGSVPVHIYVAQGTYFSYNPNVAATAFNSSLTLVNDVTMEGGFAGRANPSAPRNMGLYPTYLSAAGVSAHVVTAIETNSSAVLDGFIITDGNASGAIEPDGDGDDDTTDEDSGEGGGLLVEDGSATIRNCLFENNIGYYGGGAVYCDTGSPTFTNCAFLANGTEAANAIGGAMLNDEGSSPVLVNCTFASNSATEGGAICDTDYSQATLTNCILWGDTGGEIFNTNSDVDYSSAAVQYSDVDGATVYPGTKNIDSNPLFVNAAIGNLQLTLRSPAIRAGLNSAIAGVTTDLAGNPRIALAGTNVDMGAYEFQGPFILYVDQTALLGAQTGESWSNAFTSLQQALSAAIPGETIEVAQGSYVAGLISNPSLTFTLENGVTIQGGYATGGSMTPDPAAYPTILNGADSFYHVVTAPGGTNSTAVLDGFTIEDGAANGSGSNSAGGGMIDSGGSPTLIDCTFTGNSASEFGGGMANLNSSSPTLVNCVFYNNTAGLGGGAGMYNDESSPYLFNCVFNDNLAAEGVGGGMFNDDSNPIIINNTFTANVAIYGAAIDDVQSSPEVVNSILWNDTGNSEIYNDTAGTPITVEYSDVKGGGFTGIGDLNPAENPNFFSATNLELQPGSPCINTGNLLTAAIAEGDTKISVDAAGNARTNSTDQVDMGAYENQGPVSLIFIQSPPSQDTLDSFVNVTVEVEQNNSLSSIADGTTIELLDGTDVVDQTAVGSNGQATYFSTVLLNTLGANQTLTAVDEQYPSFGTATSAPFSVVMAGTPTLSFVVEPPATATVGQSFNVEVQLTQGGQIAGVGEVVDLSSPGLSSALGELINSSGEATFPVSFANSGDFTLAAIVFNTAGSIVAETLSTPVVVSTAPPLEAQLQIDVPGNVSANSIITPGITVTASPVNNTPLVNGSYVTLSLVSTSPGGGVLGSSNSFTAEVSNGRAVFTGLAPSITATYNLEAVDPGDESANASFDVAPSGDHLVFTTQPGNFAAAPDVPVPTFIVTVENSLNDPVNVPYPYDEIDISVYAGPSIGEYGGTYSGNTNGGSSVTFNNFFLGAEGQYQLQAVDSIGSALKISGQYTYSAGPPEKFAISAPTTAAGSAVTVSASAEDGFDTLTTGYSGTVTLNLINSSGVTVDALLVPAVQGVATTTFNAPDLAGTYQITASDSSIGVSTNTGVLFVTPAAPYKLAFFQQPGTTTVGYDISNIEVAAEDIYGNVEPSYSTEVTLAIATPPNNQLSGITTATMQDGIATFNGAYIDAVGTYTLSATDNLTGLISGTSSSFNVNSPGTLYVDQTATNGNDNGMDWPDAYLTVQQALAVAIPGDTIQIAQGTYSPGSAATNTFTLLSGVTLEGGFATGGASAPTPAATPTVLDGDEINYNVVTADSADSTAVLEDFTITGGQAYGFDADTESGGGLVADGGTPSIINCIFTDNIALSEGGAVYVANQPAAESATFTDCTFESNEAVDGSGGAVYCLNASPTFLNDQFTGNYAGVNGGAIVYASGGGGGDITNCLFTLNNAGDGYGGAVANFGSPVAITNCTFTGNSADISGGAIFDSSGQPSTVTNCIVWNDYTNVYGSGAHEIDNAIISFSDVSNFATLVSDGAITDGGGNIDTDPLFVNPTNSNPSYQLQPTSPCINAGGSGANVAPQLIGILTDLAGNPRIVDGIVDMGAYEAQVVDVYWTGDDNTNNWNNPANWSDNLVPTQNDVVTIGSLFNSIQVPAGTFAAGSLSSQSPVEITSGGTLTLSAPSSFTGASLTVDNGGTLRIGSGNTAVTGVSFTGNIVDNGSVLIDPFTSVAANAYFEASVSGSGAVGLNGVGDVYFEGNNSYLGQTTIASGASLYIQTASNLPTDNNVANNGALVIESFPLLKGNNTIVVGNLSGNGSLQIQSNAYLRLAPNSGPSQVGSLSVASNATLDVTNNKFFIDYGTTGDPISTIQSSLASGYNGAAWTGSGIVSSTVASENTSQSHLLYSVGYADGADGIVSGLSSGQIEIMPTLVGDAKLQGNVVFGDFQILAQYFGHAGGWDEGNFTYGSAVDFGDFQLLAQNFGQTASLSAAAVANPVAAPFDIELQPTDADAATSIFDGTIFVGTVNGLPMFSDVALDLAGT